MTNYAETAVNKEIDARGSFCPGPLMELIRGIKVIPVQGVVALTSSDPGSQRDIPTWVRKAKHELLGTFPTQDSMRFVVRKFH